MKTLCLLKGNVMKEKNFENRVKSFLKDQGCWFIKYWSGNAQNGKKFTKDGIPDILCCCNGKFIGIELKASDGKPSDLQTYNLKKIDGSGGYGILLYPDKYEEFQKLIKLINCDNSMHQEIYKRTFEGRWET